MPFKAWLGQWAHSWPDRADWWDQVMVAWFDQFLNDRDTGILDAPRVQIQDDTGRWRHEVKWLDGTDEVITLHPQSSGALTTSPGADTVRYHDYRATLSRRATRIRYAENGKVVFTSAVLEHDVVISGMPRFEGTVTASGLRASLVLSLVELLPDGTQRPFNWAAQSLNHVNDPAAGRLSVAGRPQQVGVSFFPQDSVVRAGSRILLVAAGNTVGTQPSLQPVSDGSVVVLDLGDARLTLPVDTSLYFESQ